MDSERDLIGRQAALTALQKHPSWPDLVDEVERKVRKIEKVVLNMTLVRGGAVDSEQLAYLRGFVHGMRWLTAVPQSAEGSLERYLRKQGVNVEAA